MISSVEKTGSFLTQLGAGGFVRLIWRASPVLLRPIAFPYGLLVYYRFLRTSTDLETLLSLHADCYCQSFWFRLLRPRYRIIRSAFTINKEPQQTVLAEMIPQEEQPLPIESVSSYSGQLASPSQGYGLANSRTLDERG